MKRHLSSFITAAAAAAVALCALFTASCSDPAGSAGTETAAPANMTKSDTEVYSLPDADHTEPEPSAEESMPAEETAEIDPFEQEAVFPGFPYASARVIKDDNGLPKKLEISNGKSRRLISLGGADSKMLVFAKPSASGTLGIIACGEYVSERNWHNYKEWYTMTFTEISLNEESVKYWGNREAYAFRKDDRFVQFFQQGGVGHVELLSTINNSLSRNSVNPDAILILDYDSARPMSENRFMTAGGIPKKFDNRISSDFYWLND